MDLSHLNQPQRDAVLCTEGPLLVLAGAGSGKTRVITHRIAHLLERKVPARAILAVTFTNKAAEEMRARVVKLAGPRAVPVTLSTFHAFGAEVLRGHLHRLGYPRRYAIADTGDQLAIVKRAMKERQIDDRSFDARKVLTLISRAKNANQEPQPRPEGQGDDLDLIAHQVFPLYQLALKAQGAVDFDDLIVLPSRLFEARPEVAAEYRERFRYLMVDEFQDTNAAQLTLLQHLAGPKGNVCVVGDDDQCIYGWRGAEVKNILEFEKVFPGAREVRLEQNYRSTEVIIESANAVIARNPARRAKRMWTKTRGGAVVTVVAAPTEEDEARYVAAEVQRALLEGLPAHEVAVLYRVNGQPRFLEEFLREKSVPYAVHGGNEFFDRRDVKDVIAYFKVLVNPKDEVSLLRIVNVPARGIGDVTVERLTRWALERGVPLWRALEEAHACAELPAGAADKVGEFVAMVRRYRAAVDKGNLAHHTRELLREIDFAQAARASAATAAAGDRRVQAVNQVLRSLESYEKREGKKASLLTYLNRLSLDSRDEEEAKEKALGRVSLMTLHGAKGLEWRLVFMMGLEEDLLPHSGMQGEPPNPEEERRLCYVGMTRARERLVLTRAATRVKRGKLVPRTPSRYLEDIPEQYRELVDLGAPPEGPPTDREMNFFASLRERLKARP